MKEIKLTNLGDAHDPQNIVVRVNTVRHDDKDKPFKVTRRAPIEIRAQDGSSSYYLGRLPISEYRTVPNQKRRGESMKQFFSQLEITVAVPEGATGINCFTKWFYPRPGGLREISGFKLGQETLFSQRFPIEHLGKTAQSKVGTNESRNNIYVAVCGEKHFAVYAVSVVVQENGVWLVHSQVYSGEVFQKGGELRCPLLESEKCGATRDALIPFVKVWFKDKVVPELPEEYRSDMPMNISCLRNGGNATGKWCEAVVHMESPPRQLSFGLAKDPQSGEARFVYVNWDELPTLPDKRIKRVPFGSVIQGWLETDSGGRYKLTKIRFLPTAQAKERWLAVYDPERVERLGESAQEPEWLQKRKAKMGVEANLGQQFAKELDLLLASLAK